MEKLFNFLENQRLIVLASFTENDPWVANVYYGIDKDFKFYFISSQETKHCQQILKNPLIAFSISWFNVKNHQDRKGVQGKGKCRLAKAEEMELGIILHNKNFPEFIERANLELIKSKENPFKVWVIEPHYIKFWNDELYGINGNKEFTFH